MQGKIIVIFKEKREVTILIHEDECDSDIGDSDN